LVSTNQNEISKKVLVKTEDSGKSIEKNSRPKLYAGPIAQSFEESNSLESSRLQIPVTRTLSKNP
jgi:hypothetical protein